MHVALTAFIETENLPVNYLQTVEQWYLPLLNTINFKQSIHDGTFILGINGSQGSGKSTLASLLVILLREELGLTSINLSLDDFYLTLKERQALAANVHPFLKTRGVPGTHDTNLAIQTISALKQTGDVAIPRFDKATDDRASESEWSKVHAPVDVIILEGWCLGVEPQLETELQDAVNELEEEDGQGVWRSYINNKLASEYRELFNALDTLLMLKAPDFAHIIDWRLQQENKLRDKSDSSADLKLMDRERLIRFISHYERLTRHALETLPAKADVVYLLNDDQSIQAKIKG